MSTEKHKSQRSESINIGPFRCAYLWLHEKQTKRPNGTPHKTPRYSIGAILVPKLNADPAQCANYATLSKLCMDAAVKAWGSWPQGGHWPIQDGDAPVRAKPAAPGQPVTAPKEYPWRKGHWIIEATNYLDPGPRVAVMQGSQAMEIPAKVVNGKTMYKSGDYFYVNVMAWTFHNEKFGVNFGFEGALWVREGEAIGGSGPKSAAEMFGGIAPVAVPAMGPPVAPMAPPMAPVAPQAYAPNPPGTPPGAVASPPMAPPAPTPPQYSPPAAPGPLPPLPTR